jgi:hypothetical protein
VSAKAPLAAIAGTALVAALAIQSQAAGAPGAVTSVDTRPPSQTIFASSRQGVRSLYLLITVHERGKLQVRARAGSYRYSSYSRNVAPHIPNQVRLKLTGSALRSARKALRSGRRMTAVVKSTARDGAGNSRTYTRRIKLKP